jgi:uncharacterized membrane protein YjjP (DUF1212 family)
MDPSTHTDVDPLNILNLRGYGARLLANGANVTAIAEPMTRYAREIGLNDSELSQALVNLEALVEA